MLSPYPQVRKGCGSARIHPAICRRSEISEPGMGGAPLRWFAAVVNRRVFKVFLGSASLCCYGMYSAFGRPDLQTGEMHERYPGYPATRRQHPAGGGRPVPAIDRLHQRHRRGQAKAPAVHHHRRGGRALRQGHRDLGAREQRRGRGAGRRYGLLRRRGHPGGPGRDRAAARAPAGVESSLRQRGGPLQAAARRRASPWLDRVRARQPVHH